MKTVFNYSFYILLLLICNCSSEEKNMNVVITDFSSPKTFSLKPSKKGLYSTFIIKIKGESNDSIAVFENQYIKLGGKIDTTFNVDYYGGTDATFYFYPHKATKGKLNIDMKIQ